MDEPTGRSAIRTWAAGGEASERTPSRPADVQSFSRRRQQLRLACDKTRSGLQSHIADNPGCEKRQQFPVRFSRSNPGGPLRGLMAHTMWPDWPDSA